MKIIDDLASSIRGNIKTRINDPVIGPFIVSWILCNWDRLAILFFGSDKVDIRVSQISGDMAFINNPGLLFSNYDLLLLPILLTTLYVFLLPKVSVRVVKILTKTDVERYKAVIDREVQQAVKDRELNAERLLGDPGEKYLAEVVDANLAQEKAEREKLEAEAEEAKSKASVAKEQAEKENAAKKSVQLELEKKDRQSKADKAKFDADASINQAALQSSAYTSSYMFVKRLAESTSQDGEVLSLYALTSTVAAIFGYKNYSELLADKNFNNDSLNNLKYVLCDSGYLSKELDSILSKEELKDDALDSGWLIDHIQAVFEGIPYQFVFPDALEAAVYESIEEDQFSLIDSEAISSAQAETDTYLDEVELYDKSHSYDGSQFVVEVSGRASGEHRKESGVPSPGIDFTVTASLSPRWGKYGLEDYEMGISAKVEDWSSE